MNANAAGFQACVRGRAQYASGDSAAASARCFAADVVRQAVSCVDWRGRCLFREFQATQMALLPLSCWQLQGRSSVRVVSFSCRGGKRNVLAGWQGGPAA